MIKVNEYFGGKVKSLGMQLPDGKATIGIILAGEYEFGTSTKEIMNVTAGTLDAQLPGKSDWKTYKQGTHFEVASGQKFKVRCTADVAYLCLYK